jgi:Uncharacterized secreted protein
MSKVMTALALSLSALVAAPVAAEETKGVVELFTSQGCSSCPPADRTLAGLIEEGGVIALSYHVDYWNYLGWRDTLSDPANTARQYGYAATWKRRSVYTPQAVVNGRDHVNGADGAAIRRLVSDMADSGRGLAVDVSLKMAGNGIEVGIGEGEGKADVVAVYFDDVNTVAIERGENTGRTVTYRHSVRSVETIGMWSGAPVTLTLPKSVLKAHKGRGCAILLQSVADDGSPAAILGAAMMEPRPAR